MKISLFLLKFIVIIVLFLFLYNNQSLDFTILKELHSNPSTISFAIALMVLSTTLAGIRLLVILKILGIHVTAFRSIGVTFIGHLSANVALGPLFSEVVRLTYLFGNSKRGLSHALSALLIDRLLGMAGLLIVITAIIVIFAEKATLASPNNTELLSLMIGVFLSIIIVIFFSPAIMSKLSIFLQKFGKVKWSQQAEELSAALRNFQTLPTKTFFVFLLMILTHMVSMGANVYFCLQISNYLVRAEGFAIATALAQLSNALPISPAGLGVGETVFDAVCRLFAGNEITYGFASLFLALRVLSVVSGLPALIFILTLRVKQNKS